MQKLEKSAESWALTAWCLDDGEVVYWSALGWSDRFPEAEIYFDRPAADEAAARAADDVKRRIVVAPYLFEVIEQRGERVPASVRERIRARGPTTRLDHGKQAANSPPRREAPTPPPKTDPFFGFRSSAAG